MEKNYYFLAGLPRSGNTVLSSILNQNKKIYCSPLSPLPTIFWDFHQDIFQTENALRLNNKDPMINIGKNIIKNYYSEIKKPIIIDREKAWATPPNLKMIKEYITPNPKIIFTVRPIIEILASFINILPDNSYIDVEMQQQGWWYKDYLSKNDNRCDFLMQPKGSIDQILLSFNEIVKHENKDMFCIISYDNIVNNPQETMNKIYNFLELPEYNHNFNKIIKLEKDNDEMFNYPKNMHEIRSTLNKISKDPKKILSEYVINKYSNIGWANI
jgi:sulfotransferase